MAGQRITKRVVDNLKIKPKEYAVWDAQMPGFGVRVRPTGAMSYIVVYRAGSGRGAPVRRFTIAGVGKTTPENARQRAQAMVDKLTRAIVAKLHGKLNATPFQANRVLAVIGSMYAYGARVGVVPEGTNPARKIENLRSTVASGS
jgi:Arm DNA-binding domain